MAVALGFVQLLNVKLLVHHVTSRLEKVNVRKRLAVASPRTQKGDLIGL